MFCVFCMALVLLFYVSTNVFLLQIHIHIRVISHFNLPPSVLGLRKDKEEREYQSLPFCYEIASYARLLLFGASI